MGQLAVQRKEESSEEEFDGERESSEDDDGEDFDNRRIQTEDQCSHGEFGHDYSENDEDREGGQQSMQYSGRYLVDSGD